MKFYRGLIFINIFIAGIILFEIIAYAWIGHHQPCIHYLVDGLLVVISSIDIFWCVRLERQ